MAKVQGVKTLIPGSCFILIAIKSGKLSILVAEMAQRKILILTNRIPYPLKDGGNLAMNAMIEGYQRSGWAVYLLAMNTSRHFIEQGLLKKLFTRLFAFEWVDVDNRLKIADIIRNYFFSKEPEHAKRFSNEAFREKLKNVLTSFKPDVVQVESVYLSTYLPVIHQYSPAVTVLRMHNVEYQIWHGLANKHTNPVKRIYFNSLTKRIRDFERGAWKKYDLLLPITEKDAQLVGRLEDVNNMVVIPFSIDIEKIKAANNEKWVGYHIGAMDWIANREGIRWFLEKAWPKIHQAEPGFEFYFAGRHMPEEFKKLNIDGVHCVAEVPDADAFIADKKILIVPLWSGGGIRVKILEAMAAGKVVITTTYGIKGIEARQGVHYLLARKPDDFTRGVKWCLDNKPAAEEMARKAQQLIMENYESGKIIKRVTNEIESLLAGKQERDV